MAKARQAGKQYSSEVSDFVAKELNISDGVRNAKNKLGGSAFEYDVYHAGLRLDKINVQAESKKQEERLKALHKGDKTGTLYVYQSGKGKLFRGTEVVNVGEGQITVRGALGGKKVTYTTDYSTFIRSLEEAIKRGKRAKKDPDLTHLLDADSDAVAFAKTREDAEIKADLEKQLTKKAADKVVIDRTGKSAGKHSEDAKGAEGWYTKGDKVYINPDNIEPLYDKKGREILSKSERIAFVAWHELGHRGVYANRLWAQFENNLKKASHNPFVSQLAQAFQADRAKRGMPIDEVTAVEEALVEINAAMITGKMDALTAKWGVTAPFNKNGVAPFYRRLVELLRQVVGYIKGKPSTTTGEVLGKPKAQDSNQLNNTQLFELLQTITDGATAPIKSSVISSVKSQRNIQFSLPMDFESRMQRARDMGFDTETTWYHGTPAAGFTSFNDAADDSLETNTGRTGIYLTNNKKIASTYANQSKESVSYTDVGNINAKDIVDNPERYPKVTIHNSYGEPTLSIDGREIVTGSREEMIDYLENHLGDYFKRLILSPQDAIYPLLLKKFKPNEIKVYDFAGKNWKHYERIDKGTYDGYLANGGIEGRLSSSAYIGKQEVIITTDYLAEKAKQQGFKAVRFDNVIDNASLSGGEASTVISVFDPRDIRSIDAEFNPAEKESSDIRYSLPPTNAELDAQIADTVKRYGGEKAYKKAKADGKTKLHYRQWIQVRMPAFKRWFGDWEKPLRIEKLRQSKPIVITGKEVHPDGDIKQYKKNAMAIGKSIRDTFTNKDTGRKIKIIGSSIKEVLQHDYKNAEQLQSIAAIPKIIEEGILIDTLPNEDKTKRPDIEEYDYYVVGLNIGGVDYTVKAAVGVTKNGDLYYDHKLTQIEKGELLSLPSRITNPVGDNASPFKIDDKRLLSVLQVGDVSKVTDPDTGEPMVVYHATNSEFSIFERKGYNHKGHFFSDNADVAKQYGSHLMPVFLNVSDMTEIDGNSQSFNAAYDNIPDFEYEINNIGRWSGGIKIASIYDHPSGLRKGKRSDVYAVADANQIKSAVSNDGSFSPDNDDIRFSLGVEDPRTPPPPFRETPPAHKRLLAKLKEWYGDYSPWTSADAYDKLFDNMGELERLSKHGKDYAKMMREQGKQAEGEAVEKLLTGVRDGFKTVNAKIHRDIEQEVEPMMVDLHEAMGKLLQGDLGKQLAKVDRDFGKGTKAASKFMEHMDYYIRYVLHGKERNATIYALSGGKQLDGSGMTNKEIDDLIAHYADVPSMDKAARELYKNHIKPILDYRNQRLLDAGLLTQGTINKGYNWEFYIPLYGRPEEIDPVTDKVMQDQYSSGGQFGKGGRLKEGEHKLKGRRGTDAHSLFETVFTATNVAVSRARMAEAKKAVYEAVQNEVGAKALQATMVEHDISQKKVKKINEDGEVTWQGANLFDYKAKDAEDTLVYQHGDKAYVIKIENKRALNAMKNLNKHLEYAVLRFSQWATRKISSTYTRFSPNFWLVNKFRDSQAQWLYLLADAPIGEQADTYRGAVKNIGNRFGTMRRAAALNAKYTLAWKDSNPNSEYHQWLEKYRDLGGVTTFSQFMGKDQLKSFAEEFQQANIDLTALSGREAWQAAKKQGKKLGKLVDMINDHMELTTRVSAFQALVESGVSEQKAAMWTKDVMNFETRGDIGRVLQAFYPFVTTSSFDIQRLSRVLFKTKEGKVLFAGVITTLLMLQELFAYLGGEDEDGTPLMDKVPLGIASSYLVLPLDDRGQGIRIPVGFGIGQMANSMAASTRRFASGQYTPTEWLGNIVINAGIRNLTPIRPSDVKGDPLGMAIQTIAPLTLKPIVQMNANQNHFGNQIHKDERFISTGELKHSSGYPWTHDVYKNLATWLYQGTEIDVAPESIAHMMNSYLGGMARTPIDAIEGISDHIGWGEKGTSTAWKQAPIIGAFVQTEPREDSTIYSQTYKKLKDAHQRYEYEKARDGNFKKYENGEAWYKKQQAFDKRLKYWDNQEKLAREQLTGEQLREALIYCGKQKRYLKMQFNYHYKNQND